MKICKLNCGFRSNDGRCTNCDDRTLFVVIKNEFYRTLTPKLIKNVNQTHEILQFSVIDLYENTMYVNRFGDLYKFDADENKMVDLFYSNINWQWHCFSKLYLDENEHFMCMIGEIYNKFGIKQDRIVNLD